MLRGRAERRLAAVLLALLALVCGYFVLLQWWLVAPLRTIDADMATLRATQARDAGLLASRPALERALAAQQLNQSGAEGALLPERDAGAASAALMQRVVDIVRRHAGQGAGCDAPLKMPLDRPSPPGPFREVSVSITLRCGIAPLTAILHDIEQGRPYLFVTELTIFRPSAQGNEADARLEAQFTLAGYIAESGRKASP